MKLAILFFGISKMEEYNHPWNGETYSIDYAKSYENYKTFIFDYFKGLGYDIDVYFTTNVLDNKSKKELCETYKPIKYNFIESKERITGRNGKLNNVIDLCLESGFTYNLILITRFDLLFQKKFGKSNIDFDKFNIVSKLEKQHLICDNFYLFPYKYLKPFSNIVKKNLKIHSIKFKVIYIMNLTFNQ